MQISSAENTHIFLVSVEGRIAGAEYSLLLFVKYLCNDFDVIVICPAKSPLARQLAKIQICTYYLPQPPSCCCSKSLWFLYLVKVSCSLIRIIYKARPKAIHANNFHAAIASILPAVLTRRKLLWHARDLIRFRLASRICGFFCEKVIAVSQMVKESLVKQGVKSSKIAVVHNGIEVTNHNTQKTLQAEPSDSSIKFANIGQFVPWKNQILFVEAACRLIAKSAKAEFLLVGDDILGRGHKYKTKLLDQIHSCEIPEKFHLLGWQEEMEQIWEQIDCLVHTAGYEPFGRVIIEAMAHKIPVIAVNGGGPSEIIRAGKTGILVEPDNPEALREAMLKIINDRGLAIKLALAGYEYVVSQFSAGKTASQIQRIYGELLVSC